jgi:tRNA U34 5-methylaminomethyl-2-thiouridine-forming methyltransferase MnmC
MAVEPPSPQSISEALSPHDATGTVIEIEFIVDDLRAALPSLIDSAEGSFDLVFHDPFSPQHLPELWTQELFAEYFRLLAPRQGRLLTYSAAAAVRGGLFEAGFALGRTIGVGDKSGGTAAWIPSNTLQTDTVQAQSLLTKAITAGAIEELTQTQSLDNASLSASHDLELYGLSQIQPLTVWEQAYIASRAGIPYRDPGLNTSRADILEHRVAEQNTSERISGSVLLKRKANGQDGDDRYVHAHARGPRSEHSNPTDGGYHPRDNALPL